MMTDQTCVDGLSITRGSPRQHLWTLAVGWNEDTKDKGRCPRDKDPFNFNNFPDFVGGHYHCKTGFATSATAYFGMELDML